MKLMSGKSTSRAKLPRSSSRPGVIQLRPPAHPATVGGEKRRWPRAAGGGVEVRLAGNVFEAELLISG